MTAKHRAEKLLERQQKFSNGSGRFYVFVVHEDGVEVQFIQANTVFGAMAQIDEIGVFVEPDNAGHSMVPHVQPYPVLREMVLDLELP
jgi:hypothetical protein